MARRQPYSLKPNGKPRVLSGIIFMNRKGSRWRDASKEYGPHKTPHTRWKRWSGKGIFEQMMAGPAAEHGEGPTVTIDATCLTAHRTASSPGAEKGAWPPEWTESEGQETVGGIASPRTRGRNQCAAGHGKAMSREGPGCMPSAPENAARSASSSLLGWAACRASNGCSATEAVVLTGSGKRSKTKGYAPASLAESNARRPSKTTGAATATRSCSDGSRTGVPLRPEMTAVPRLSSPPSLSQ